jgi:hypothetical protein
VTQSHLFDLSKRISGFRRKSTFCRICVGYIVFLRVVNDWLSLNLRFCLRLFCELFCLWGGCLLLFDGGSCGSLGGGDFLLLFGLDEGSHSHTQ